MIDLESYYRLNRHRQVKDLTRKLGGDVAQAEDIVQEAYIRALKYASSYDPLRSGMNTWFNSILYNTLRSIKKGEKESVEDSPVVDETSSIPRGFLETAIIQYPSKYRTKRVLHLYYMLGYNSREISEIETNVTQTNVTTILSRFREWMKEKHG